MHDKHWTDEELLLMLFDVMPRDERRAACPVCTRRWEEIRSRYESRPAIAADISDEQLASQRIAIRSRLEKRRAVRLILAPSLGALALIAIAALLLFTPSIPNEPVLQTVSEDAELEDAFRISLSLEPEAIEPVQLLFEEQQ
jgi:hypothetical protein